MVAGVVTGTTDFLLSSGCRVTSSDRVGRVLGRGRYGFVVALQAP